LYFHFRKILLFLDNAPVHPIDLELSNIKLLFFPPSTTSKIQPLDQGIIRCFKIHYRSRLVKHIISSCTLALTSDQVVVTTLDAIYWIQAAWNNVSESTIRNTFRTAGFERYDSISTVANDTYSETLNKSYIINLTVSRILDSHFDLSFHF
jgi:hypothetical protein